MMDNINHIQIKKGNKRKAAAMEPSQCPLEPNTFVKRMLPFGLCQVEEIEDHIASSTSCHHPPLKDLVCSRGTTPLLLACSFGDLEAVKRIIEYWGVGVQASAIYCVSPIVDLNERYTCRHVAGASPLFVAACNGHLDIVRYLVENGADVAAITGDLTGSNADTHHGLTPLHGTFLSWLRVPTNVNTECRQKIVEIANFLLEAGANPSALSSVGSPIWTYELCGVEATIALINHGLDFNHQRTTLPPYESNITILHEWAGRDTEEDSFVIVKLLADKGADLRVKDDAGFTPLLRAAYGNDGTTQWYSRVFSGPNLKTLDFLLERDDFDSMEKIEAMELAGAVILLSSKSASKYPRAFDYWRRALQLRQMEKEGTKIPLQRESGGTFEWVTNEDLERVIQHPSEHKIQALFVGLRILSSMSTSALSTLLDCDSLKYYRNELTNRREFLKLLHLSWATLESLRYFEEDESYEWGLDHAYYVKETTSYLMKALSGLGNDPALLTVEIITTSLQHISDSDRILFYYYGDGTYFVEENLEDECTSHMKRLLKLVTLLAGLPGQTLDQTTFKESFKSFVQQARRDYDWLTLLQMACKPSYLSFHPSRMATIRLLLDSGADPNADDYKGNASLHILAQSDHQKHGKLVAVAAGILLENGAHLDQVNDSRKTAADVWIDLQKKKRKRLRNRNEGTDDKLAEDAEVEAARWKDLLPSWLRDDFVPKLQCLTARVISSHKVPFSRLPPSLRRFVKMH